MRKLVLSGVLTLEGMNEALKLNYDELEVINTSVIEEEVISLLAKEKVKFVENASGNVVSVKVADKMTATIFDHPQNSVVVIESHIDDCSPEVLGYAMEVLLNAGALDVAYSPIFMKKNRPAYQLIVICKAEDLDTMKTIIFKETTTIGFRYRYEARLTLSREKQEVETPLGIASVKVVTDGQMRFAYPEYEDAKRLAKASGLALKTVMDVIRSSVDK